jgi:hypothetical protein
MSNELYGKLLNLAKSSSTGLISFLENKNTDFSGLTNINVAKKMAQEWYSLKDEDFIAVDFVFWIAYFVERAAKDLIIYPEVSVGIREDSIKYIKTLFDDEKMVELASYFTIVLNSEITIEERETALTFIIDNLYFGDKIKIIEKFYSSKNSSIIKLMRKIQDLRNHIAHGRLDKLLYDSLKLSEGKGQLKLFVDLMNVMLEKNDTNKI